MSFFHRNLNAKGRLLRGVGALSLAVGAFSAWNQSLVAAAILFLSAAFVAFEALRGWCVLRACGLKTKL